MVICAAIRCEVYTGGFLCNKHWEMLPKELRGELIKALQAGEDPKSRPVVDKAIYHIKELDNPGSSKL